MQARGLTKDDEKNMNSFHRRQLIWIRIILDIKWPNKISNKKLYEKTNTKPISIEITERRWKRLGHVLLRMNKDSPARKGMKFFFENRSNKKFSGRKRATIVTTINRDIKRTKNKHAFLDINELKTQINLHNICVKARNRKKWTSIVKLVVDAAYSETS